MSHHKGKTSNRVMASAFIASAGCGYLLPLGATIQAIFLAQIIAEISHGEYFPGSIMAPHSQGSPIGVVSCMPVFLTGIAGTMGTFLWRKQAGKTK